MATVEPITGHRKRRTRSEAATEQAATPRPQRELVLEGLLAPGLRVRIWTAGHSLTPSQV